MGRYWCRTDPTFKVNGKPLQLSILAAVPELKAEHTFITFVTNDDAEVDLSHGQAKREVFGGPFTFVVQEKAYHEDNMITVRVVTEEDATGAELVITALDHSGVFGNMVGLGYTDEDVPLDPVPDHK